MASDELEKHDHKTLHSIVAFLGHKWILVVVTIVAPLVLWYYYQRETKSLVITIESDVPVVSVQQQYSGELDLLYKSRRINSLHVLDLRIRNDGNQSIERADFDSPLSFTFSGTLISTPTIALSKPRGLTPQLLSITANTITISPLLLNSGDEFTLRALIADRIIGKSIAAVNGRVKDVRSLDIGFREESEWVEWSRALPYIASIMGFAITFYGAFSLTIRTRRGLSNASKVRRAVKRWAELKPSDENYRQIQELARLLDIKNHDWKANMLLLRVKIESQLRELARTAKIEDRYLRQSIPQLSNILKERGILPHSLSSAIRDLAPIMNRELHESESFLSSEDFDSAQRLALEIVARLDPLLPKFTTGMKPGSGKFVCKICGQQITLDDSSEAIPPCPHCNSVNYRQA